MWYNVPVRIAYFSVLIWFPLVSRWFLEKASNFLGGEYKLNTKLYVGNLPYSINDAQLMEIFSQAGNVVSAVVITDRNTGRSKGFGFVEMGDEESAKKAIETFNGSDMEGRKLVVNEARPKAE